MFSALTSPSWHLCPRGMHRIWCDTLCELVHETQIEICVFNAGSTNYVCHKILGVGSGEKCVKILKCSHKEGQCEFWFCRFAYFWDVVWLSHLNSTVIQILSFLVCKFLVLVFGFLFSAKKQCSNYSDFGIQCGFQFLTRKILERRTNFASVVALFLMFSVLINIFFAGLGNFFFCSLADSIRPQCPLPHHLIM